MISVLIILAIVVLLTLAPGFVSYQVWAAMTTIGVSVILAIIWVGAEIKIRRRKR